MLPVRLLSRTPIEERARTHDPSAGPPSGMVDNDPSLAPKPGKESAPTAVREPDNTRPPAEPTPKKPMQPQGAENPGDVA